MGRPLAEARTNLGATTEQCRGTGRYRLCTNSPVHTLNVGYTYNLDGSLSTLTYPSGDIVTYTSGGAGRPLQVNDSVNNYVGYSGNSATYTPNGALASMTNGYTGPFTGYVTSNSYNKRLQPGALITASPSQTVLSLTYSFNPGMDNGNIQQIANNVRTDATAAVAFAYDSLNRLSKARTTTTGANCWGEAYHIDAWGNLTSISGPSGMNGCLTEGLSVTANPQNQLSGFTYDIAGNVIADGNGNQLAYDAESTLANFAGVTYDYDADGVRVEKSSGTMYWPGPGGEVLAETDLGGNINEEYVYFNGSRIARVDRPSGTVQSLITALCCSTVMMARV